MFHPFVPFCVSSRARRNREREERFHAASVASQGVAVSHSEPVIDVCVAPTHDCSLGLSLPPDSVLMPAPVAFADQLPVTSPVGLRGGQSGVPTIPEFVDDVIRYSSPFPVRLRGVSRHAAIDSSRYVVVPYSRHVIHECVAPHYGCSLALQMPLESELSPTSVPNGNRIPVTSSLGLIGGRPQAATFPELVDNISQHSPPSPTHLHDVPNEFSRLRVTMLPLGTDSILSPIGCHNVFCMMNRNQICM